MCSMLCESEPPVNLTRSRRMRRCGDAAICCAPPCWRGIVALWHQLSRSRTSAQKESGASASGLSPCRQSKYLSAHSKARVEAQAETKVARASETQAVYSSKCGSSYWGDIRLARTARAHAQSQRIASPAALCKCAITILMLNACSGHLLILCRSTRAGLEQCDCRRLMSLVHAQVQWCIAFFVCRVYLGTISEQQADDSRAPCAGRPV